MEVGEPSAVPDQAERLIVTRAATVVTGSLDGLGKPHWDANGLGGQLLEAGLIVGWHAPIPRYKRYVRYFRYS
jgi:hypothetical protein